MGPNCIFIYVLYIFVPYTLYIIYFLFILFIDYHLDSIKSFFFSPRYNVFTQISKVLSFIVFCILFVIYVNIINNNMVDIVCTSSFLYLLYCINGLLQQLLDYIRSSKLYILMVKPFLTFYNNLHQFLINMFNSFTLFVGNFVFLVKFYLLYRHYE